MNLAPARGPLARMPELNGPPTITPSYPEIGGGFTVAASLSGTGQFSYRWTKNGDVVSGANDAALTIPSATPADAGVYAAVATDYVGSVSSSSVVLGVTTAAKVSGGGSEVGADIRRGFIPDDGFLFMSADYSQIELRVLAHLSGDPAFVEAFRKGTDIHRQTAAIVFDVPVADVSAEMRAAAKTINFATIYGQGPHALSQQLKITHAEAKEFELSGGTIRSTRVLDQLSGRRLSVRARQVVVSSRQRLACSCTLRPPKPASRTRGSSPRPRPTSSSSIFTPTRPSSCTGSAMTSPSAPNHAMSGGAPRSSFDNCRRK